MLDRVTRFAERAAGRARLPPGQHRPAAQRVGERDLPGRRPGRGAVGPAGAPARVPHRDRDRLRAGLDGRAAGRGRGAHPAGAARRPAAAACWACPTRRRVIRARAVQGRELRPVRVPARHRAGRRRRRALRRAGRDHRADAPARPAVGAAVLVHPVLLGLRRGVRPGGPVGPLAGRDRGRPGRAGGARPARRRARRPGWPRSAPGRSGTGWCTPTPGWPTCWWTAAGSASSTSTTPGSAGTCTTSARR